MSDSHDEDERAPECTELAEGLPYRFTLDRRAFSQLVGAGLLVTAFFEGGALARRAGRRGRDTIAERLHLGTDGTITVLSGKVEVGQGARTQIAMAAAEELRVAVEDVRVVLADSARCPRDGTTAGSRTTPATIPRVRRACAAARDALVAAQARRWNVAPAELDARDGRVHHRASGRSAAYREITAELDPQAFVEDVRSDVALTRIEDARVLGRSVPRANGRDVVTGRHRHPSDVQLPNLAYGAVLRAPRYGATPTAVDLEPARALPGVVVVRDGDFVGVAAPTSHEARKAVELLERSATWTFRDHPRSDDLASVLRAGAVADGDGRGRRRRSGERRGSPAEALERAAIRRRANYFVPYVQHAPLEPRAAVATWSSDGRLTVWTGTQAPERVHGQLAEAFRIAPEKVHVHVPDTGGGFGGKHTGECAIEAARLARAAGRPVSLRWSRAEEFQWAYFRPAGVLDLEGGLDDQGRLVAWTHENLNSGASALAMPYAVPNVSTRYREVADPPLRQGSYRALAATANTFAREAFLDELARAADRDPLAFRLAHLEEPRLRAVLEAAARRFEWSARRTRSGARAAEGELGVGLACGTEKGSYVATCAEVAVDRAAARFAIRELVVAFECGTILNPRNLEAQVRGCLVQGLGPVLREEIRFEGGRLLNGSFASYGVPRFADVPPIGVELVDRRDLDPVGAGETPIIALAPAVANAIHAVTGTPLRSLPLRWER